MPNATAASAASSVHEAVCGRRPFGAQLERGLVAKGAEARVLRDGHLAEGGLVLVCRLAQIGRAVKHLGRVKRLGPVYELVHHAAALA